MPRYYLHILHGTEVVRDEGGSEMVDVAAARLEAIAAALEICSDSIRSGVDPRQRAIEIWDDHSALDSVTFVEALGTLKPYGA
jgi:hypothetical protein